MSLLKLAIALLVGLLPSFVKILVYRWVYQYQIGKGVRIGFGTVLVGIRQCRIDDHVRIGGLNLFYRVGELNIETRGHVGWLNLFRGGRRIKIGSYATVLRFNVFNSILNPDIVNTADPVLELGTGVVVTTGHWLDFTDRITIGAHSILGGRNSSFWTHNRQRTRPITVDVHCYLGSGVQLAPGVEIPEFCIVALGAVLMGSYNNSHSLIVGNPAVVKRTLRDRDIFLVTRKTRNDIPDETAWAMVPAELKSGNLEASSFPHAVAESHEHVSANGRH